MLSELCKFFDIDIKFIVINVSGFLIVANKFTAITRNIIEKLQWNGGLATFVDSDDARYGRNRNYGKNVIFNSAIVVIFH